MPRVPISDRSIAEAGDALRRGSVVAFPTETVYGLGADVWSVSACARIFDIKGRPRFDPLIVHVPDVEAIAELCARVDERVFTLAAALWPGPLTLVLPKSARVPDIVTAGQSTVAVRVPAHPVARALLLATGRPIAAPSANPFGYVSPTSAEHVEEQLGDRVDLILDGGRCAIGIESTIVDLSGAEPSLLRLGGMELDRIEALIGPLSRPQPSEAPLAPGQLESHYAPRASLSLLEGRASAAKGTGRVGLLAFAEPAPAIAETYASVEVLSAAGDLREAAANLFASLRRLDAARLDHIVAEPVPKIGIGLAIDDRLRRAAARRA